MARKAINEAVTLANVCFVLVLRTAGDEFKVRAGKSANQQVRSAIYRSI